MSVRVTVWNEYRHEREREEVAEVYPDGMHETIAEYLRERGHDVRTATLDEPEHGLTADVLAETDVLLWWSHTANDELSDEIADRVVEHVLDGMGFVPLHAAKNGKPFKRLMGTGMGIKYRHAAETERLWVIEPGHPIVEGIGEYIELPETEMYGEPHEIPAPETLVFVSWFEGGEVFRSGCCYTRGRGRIFYFRPGHELYPIYRREDVVDVLDNAIGWAAPTDGPPASHGEREPLEHIE